MDFTECVFRTRNVVIEVHRIPAAKGGRAEEDSPQRHGDAEES